MVQITVRALVLLFLFPLVLVLNESDSLQCGPGSRHFNHRLSCSTLALSGLLLFHCLALDAPVRLAG